MSLWLPCGLHGFAVPNTVTVTVTVTVSLFFIHGMTIWLLGHGCGCWM
jgi:hypothetical protein